jgi:microsomal dipeptidase-like Zn-dependent dipeptidase
MPSMAGAPVIDLHVHGLGFLPRPVAAAHRRVIGRDMPPDLGFDVLGPAGIDAVVAKAVGDGIVTRFHLGRSAWDVVVRHLRDLRRQAEDAGAMVALSGTEVDDAHRAGRLAVVLGCEGADIVDGRLDRVDELHAIGVRVLGLVHYVHNCIGTVGMPWQEWVPVPLPKREPQRGLTPFGRQVIGRMEELRILVDLAHADEATTLAACDAATAPVVSSHTGCRCQEDWVRYHSDAELRAIAATGGLVGLWPFRFGSHGVVDAEDLARHAAHLGELIGPEHLCIGTDMNGVPGYMEGYSDVRDMPGLSAVLEQAGFDAAEVAGIMGGNALRVLRAVLG